ncbi:MAG TPA: TonB-dependent receptor [Candidatus Acidoferrales bacterium]|nr:TonB-dependent receptor [Candidatus Acidoferrales bacterium]
MSNLDLTPEVWTARLFLKQRTWLPATLLVIALLLPCLSLHGQNATGRIVGVVTDKQGAVIPGVQIVITNVGTGVRSETTTDGKGFYQLLDLPVGLYVVKAEHQNFAKAVTQPQSLEINQTLKIDLQMRLGSVTETVEVNAQAARVETEIPTLGATVTGAPIQDLPLNGRNTLDLALTQPGVVPIADDLGTYGTSNGGSNGYAGISVGGARGDAVTYLLDGGINNRVTSNQVVFNPNPDAVGQFRILENNYTAEYGRNGGGVVSEVIKSGTNSLHGSLYDYLRNDAFNANDYFDKAEGNPRPVLKRNQFGGTIGGPVTVPRVINGKDRLFFFFAYQGQRQTQTVNQGFVTTYTPAELNGDFSNFDNSGPDPNVAAFLQSHPYFQPDSAKAAQAIIDSTKIDPVAMAYISANLIPTSSTGQIFPEGSETTNVDQYLGKVDYYATKNDHFSLTLGSNKQPVVNPFFGANVPGFTSLATTWDYFANIGYTKMISGTKVNEFHVTAQRWYNKTVPGSQPPTPAALGVSIQSDSVLGPPNLYYDNGLSVGFDPNVNWKADNTYAFTDSFTWIRGNHTWKFGGQFGILQENSIYAYQTDGSFYFYGPSTGVGSGNDLADFLLGAADEYYQASKAPSNEHQRQYALFAQDEWRVTPQLTLTLGLRYEYTSPETDTHGYTFTIIPGLQSQRLVNAPTDLVFPGDPGAPRGWYFPDYKNIGPRVGFAWDPFGNGKTSVRGGFGMFYDTLNGWMSDWATDEPPFSASADLFFNPSVNGQNTILSDPYGAAGQPDPFPSQIPPPSNLDFVAQGIIPFGNGNNNFVDPHLKTPYIYQYNLSVQRQVTSGLMAEIGYAGSSSHKLLTWLDANPFVLGTDTRVLNQGLASPNFGYLTTFAGVINANYNALLASLTERQVNVPYLGNVFFTLSYTWSHNLDDGSGFNSRNTQIASYDRRALYGNSDFNVPQRLTFSGGWELPFAEAWPKAPKRLTSGWSLFPIVFAQSGIPLDARAGLHQTMSDPGPSGAGDAEVVRADTAVASIHTFDPHEVQTFNGVTGNFWFNPGDFQLDPCIGAGNCPLGFYGTFRRNSFRGPKRVNADLALEKATSLTEQTKLVFRAEAFNIFNHTEFRPPSAISFTSGTFGQITGTYDPRVLQLALKFVF